MPRLLLALLALAALPLLLLLGTTLSACDTAGCDGGTLQVEDLEVGDGAEATLTSTVTVAYTVRLINGTLVEEGEETFNLGATVPGFREGIGGNLEIAPMRVGGRRKITVPPDLAYGEGGSVGGAIPPCATVIFEVELLDVDCGGGTLQIEDLEIGEGEEAAATSTVVVAYTARLEDGTIVDETPAGGSATLDLSETIPGFRQGVAGMRVGGRRRITIPPHLAYGSSGAGAIPPCATIIFEVELLGVE